MKVELINPFLEATVSVIKTMAFVDIQAGQPFIKKGTVSRGDISGVVGMTGETEGSMSLTFSQECICHIVSNMFGERISDITEEVKDAVGELTNMISGDARRRLEANGIRLAGAIPSVICGPGHEIRHVTKEPIISIPFVTGKGDFTIEICVK
ncbi:MAG: chemotaxis protein CheX [Deltaproteobacteria bacterium]|nr:chemotaxis protein CheX [Deltaproteobacteria bacterium]